MIHDTIKQRLRASLLLTPSPKLALASALRHAATLQADGTWPDLPSPAFVEPNSGRPAHLERTLLLAKAHRPAAGALDDPLRRAFDLWLAHDFISPDPRGHQVVIPRLVGEIALLYDNGISSGAAGKVMEILARSRWADWVAPVGWVERTGLDLLDIAHNHLLRGGLESAPSFFDAAFARIFREVRQAAPGEGGIQADMTFRSPAGDQRGGGFAYLRGCAQFIALAHGTPWQAPAETIKHFVGFLLDGQQWMMRQGTVDTDPPHDVFSEVDELDAMAAAVQQLAQLGNPPRRSELAAFAHRLQGHGEALSGHRHFWRARMSVHQRPAFYASLRLGQPSSGGRESRTDSFADGQTLILRSGREYRHLAIPVSARRSPGTTSFAEESAADAENTLPFWAGPCLSGGVSEGDCGMAITELRRPGLSGKKAWFFFDESVVCLGTNLQSTRADQPVRTTVNSCQSEGPVVACSPGGERRSLPVGQEHVLPSVRTVEHDGISYVFLEAARVLACSDEGTFRLQIDHGVPSKSGSYTYLALPASDDPENDARGASEEVGRVEILANSPALQAVRHGDLGLLGAAFWEPGVVLLPRGGRVAANHACLLLCREIPGGGTRLSIANPTTSPATIHVEYGGQCVCFELPGGPDAGRSMSRLL